MKQDNSREWLLRQGNTGKPANLHHGGDVVDSILMNYLDNKYIPAVHLSCILQDLLNLHCVLLYLSWPLRLLRFHVLLSPSFNDQQCGIPVDYGNSLPLLRASTRSDWHPTLFHRPAPVTLVP